MPTIKILQFINQHQQHTHHFSNSQFFPDWAHPRTIIESDKSSLLTAQNFTNGHRTNSHPSDQHRRTRDKQNPTAALTAIAERRLDLAHRIIHFTYMHKIVSACLFAPPCFPFVGPINGVKHQKGDPLWLTRAHVKLSTLEWVIWARSENRYHSLYIIDKTFIWCDTKRHVRRRSE